MTKEKKKDILIKKDWRFSFAGKLFDLKEGDIYDDKQLRQFKDNLIKEGII